MDIVDQLKQEARARANDRRIAEFGPGGGNPNAKAEDHLEWKAAEEIIRLRLEVDRFKPQWEYAE